MLQLCFLLCRALGAAPAKDMLNMLGRTLDTKLVAEMREATTGGEYAAQFGCRVLFCLLVLIARSQHWNKEDLVVRR